VATDHDEYAATDARARLGGASISDRIAGGVARASFEEPHDAEHEQEAQVDRHRTNDKPERHTAKRSTRPAGLAARRAAHAAAKASFRPARVDPRPQPQQVFDREPAREDPSMCPPDSPSSAQISSVPAIRLTTIRNDEQRLTTRVRRSPTGPAPAGRRCGCRHSANPLASIATLRPTRSACGRPPFLAGEGYAPVRTAANKTIVPLGGGDHTHRAGSNRLTRPRRRASAASALEPRAAACACQAAPPPPLAAERFGTAGRTQIDGREARRVNRPSPDHDAALLPRDRHDGDHAGADLLSCPRPHAAQSLRSMPSTAQRHQLDVAAWRTPSAPS